MTLRTRSLALVAALLAIFALLLIAAERTVALAQRLTDLPTWLQWVIGTTLAVFALAAIGIAWVALRPRRQRAPPVIDRDSIDARIQRLQARGADTSALQSELDELDARRATGSLYVALFGEISSGKSSLIAALAAAAKPATDVVGGSTREVAHYTRDLGDGRALVLADVPGSREVGGEEREALARDEALRAHAVVYVTAGDLTRAQAEELRWLGEFGKPVLLVLNKADQWHETERTALLQRLRERVGTRADAIVATRAGGSERFERALGDGRVESVERARLPDIAELENQLQRLTAPGAAALESARDRAVLAGLHERAGAVERDQRAAESRRIVARYTRRAVVGALAAVAPGSDLVIQGALATAMVRALGKLYGIPISDLQIDDFLKQARLDLRTSTSVVLAIAGNALKAFPGLGTLGGGVLHAFAYALIFDSLGKALAKTLAIRQTLDAEAAGQHLRELLGEASGQRLRRLAALTVDAVRNRERAPEDG